ncbi:MAG: GNAT family N-acetyltransferase [Cyclobacteriaceae bacterium]|nr:GNAT family N-acetyltransferase [Cyclobacteriaceae bacterium]
MAYSLRQAIAEDFWQIHKLNEAFAHFIKTPEKFKITVEQMIEEQAHFRIFVIEQDDKEIIAFATTFIAWYSWIGKTMYLDDLYVTSQHRKKGLGKMLLDHIIERARQEKCKKVHWQVSKWNTNAIEFYEKYGAIVDEVESNCDYLLLSSEESF